MGRSKRSEQQQQKLCLTLLALAAIGLATAYPELYVMNAHANGCTSHPTKGFGGHEAPVADKDTTFTITQKGSTVAATAACPGVAYDVAVNYPTRRRTLITASAGEFASKGSLDTDTTCPNRAASGSGTPQYTNTLTLPCDVKGSKLSIDVTSAGGSSDSFHKASTSLPINPISQCPDSTCPGAPSAAATTGPAAAPAAAAAAAAAAPKAAAAAEPAAKATPAAAAPAAAAAVRGAAGGSCPASNYGYACAVDAQDGAKLHYSLTDSATPPQNPCTASAAAGGQQQQQYLHMLLESPAQGYSGIGFPQTANKMYPADAVIGYVDSATGQPVVSAYHLTSYQVTQSPQNSNGLGWASNLGAAKPSGGNGPTLLCFSRPVDAPAAAVAKQLDPSNFKLNWVGNPTTAFGPGEHAITNSLTLNVADGSVVSTGAGSSKLAKQMAHGALMLLAFSVFMPLGALMARHKWVMADKNKGNIRPGWFHIHRAIQTLSILLALAGFILALVSFNVPWTNMTPGSTPHKLYNPHRVLGVIVIALSLLQVVGGLVRPGLTHKRRQNWRKGHTLMGWLAIAAGTVVVFMGAVMMHDMAGASYVSWLLPICLFLALVLIGGVVGEVLKRKLQKQGKYCPKTHSYNHLGTAATSASSSVSNLAEVTSPTHKNGSVSVL